MSALAHGAAAFSGLRTSTAIMAPEPSPTLHPIGTAFLIVVSWIWPIYFLVRASVGAALGGLIKDAPFKLAAVGLLWVLIHRLRHNSGDIGTDDPGFCERYVHAEFEYFSVFMVAFVVVAAVIRHWALRERTAELVRRRSWSTWLRSVDGVAALGLTAVSAPWFLAAVEQLLGLPRSAVVDVALRASDWILDVPRVGYTYGRLLGGGKSFVETFTENLNTTFAGGTATLRCGGDAYQGRWLAAMIPAILLVPVAIGLSCDWFSSDAKWLSVATLGLSDRANARDIRSDDASPSVADTTISPSSGSSTHTSPKGLFGVGLLVFGGWMALDAVIFVVRIATGV